MSEIYDNWERLVGAVLRREHDNQIALNDSTDPSSIASPSSATSSYFSYNSSSAGIDYGGSVVPRQRIEVPMDYSDLVLPHTEWKKMLPPGKREVAWKSAALGFFLDQKTGKNCFILGAMKLDISLSTWAEDHFSLMKEWNEDFLRPRLEMKSHPKSRFSEVAEVVHLRRVESKILRKMLSPKTSYAAYLVYEFTWSYENLKSAGFRVNLSYDGDIAKKSSIVHCESGNVRDDGWMEVELVNFYVRDGKNEITLTVSECMMVINPCLVVEGIEFRPSKGKEFYKP